MITKQDLLEAIAECQGVRSPNANTAIKLAAFYTILDHLEEREASPENKAFSEGYSFAVGDQPKVQFDGDSEFASVIDGKEQGAVWPVIDELMQTIKVMNKRLYDAVLRKLQ